MRIAEKLIHITNDLRDRYVRDYGNTIAWENCIQDMYLLNCDAEIQNYLLQEEVEIHEDVYSLGISLGVLILQKEINHKFLVKYGENLNTSQKNEMFEMMQTHIFEYIINGALNAY